MASGLYGALVGIVMFGLLRFLPQPTGAVIVWSLMCLQLAWGAMTCWRRTGLPFVTAAMINGSVMSLGAVALAFMGQPFPNLAPSSWVLFVCGLAVGILLLGLESRVNRHKWAEWSRFMEHMTPWDIVTCRHIPNLRKGGA
jgi:hypothetical protein